MGILRAINPFQTLLPHPRHPFSKEDRRHTPACRGPAAQKPSRGPGTPSRQDSGHLQRSARPGSRRRSPCLRFFCRTQGSPPHLPARTAAPRLSPLWLGRVLLLLVSSLLTPRAFQRAELSPRVGIKEPVSRAPSLLGGRLPSALEEPGQGRSTPVRAFGIRGMTDRKASEARTNKLFLLFLYFLTPIPSLLLSFAFSTHR